MLQPENKKLYYFNILGWIALCCFVYSGSVMASTLSVTKKGQLLDIKANQVPIIDILKSISEKTGLIVETSDTLTEPVSVDLKGESFEECFRQLLGIRSYIMTLSENEKNNSVPEKLLIFGNGSMTVIKYNMAPPVDERIISYNKVEFKKFFVDSKKFDKQISSKPYLYEILDNKNLDKGILITDVSLDSVFSEIGIRPGDIISNINGRPVNTTKELINQLSQPTEQAMIKIERRNNKGDIDPIYIQLR